MENVYLTEQESRPPDLHSSKDFSRLGWALSAMMALNMVGGSLIAVAISFFWPQLVQTGWYLWIISSGSLYLLALPIFVLIMHKIPSQPVQQESSFTVPQFLKMLTVSFSAMYIFNMLSLAIISILGGFKGSEIANPLETMISDSSSMLPTLLFAVLLAPVMEEIIFRGILVQKFRRWGEGVCIFLSAFSFALFHGNLSQMLYAFAIGVVLAYASVKSGTILYAVIIHTIINFFGTILVPRMALSNVMPLMLISTLFVLSMIIAGAIIFLRNIRHIALDKGDIPLTKGQKCKKMLLNPGMIVYIIVCFSIVLLTILQ